MIELKKSKSSKVIFDGIFNALKDIKENFDELECAFEQEKSELECNKWFIRIKEELIEHETALKEMKNYVKKKEGKTKSPFRKRKNTAKVKIKKKASS